MKNIIITSLIFLGVYSLTIWYFQQEIQRLTLDNENLLVENKSLYLKINLIETSFDRFMEKGEYRKPKSINKKVVTHVSKPDVKQELKTIKKDILTLDKTLDSIKTTLPNRTGQDLINSLRLKTEI
jgi:hypothetical protein